MGVYYSSFSNGFHFSAIALFLGTRIKISEVGLSLNQTVVTSNATKLLDFISVQIIPGAIIMGLLHLLLIFPIGIKIWNKIKRSEKITAGNNV